MSQYHKLYTVEDSAIIFIDHQPQMTFEVDSINKVTLINNVALMAKVAKEFKVPAVLMRSSHLFVSAPTDTLTLVCSPDGGNKSIKINQDVDLFIGKLAAKGKIIYPMREKRHGRIQLIEGDLDLNGKKLSSGDGASLDNENEIQFESAKGAHFLLFDLN